MADLIFYTNPMSRGRIVRWMLEETGAAYETVLMEYAGSMKQAPYLAINPMGKVPAIVHHGRAVTESAAICAYLADAFPQAGLAPPLAGRADYYRWLFYAAGPVEQAIVNRALGATPDERQQRMVGYGSLDLVIDVLERAVSARPYVAGDAFTAADVYVGAQIGWGIQFGALPERSGFADYLGRVQSRPAYARAVAIDDALLPAPAPAA